MVAIILPFLKTNILILIFCVKSTYLRYHYSFKVFSWKQWCNW